MVGELAAISTVLGSIFGTVVLYLSNRYANRRIAAETEKLRAETGTSLQDGFARTAALLAESARAELGSVRQEIERVRHDREVLEQYVRELVGIMRRAGLEVPPMQAPADVHLM